MDFMFIMKEIKGPNIGIGKKIRELEQKSRKGNSYFLKKVTE